MRISMLGVVASALALAWIAPNARADLLRCEGPDGRIVYTDSKARCPGADPFEPSAEVHKATGRVEPNGAASRSPIDERRDRAEARARAAEVEEGEARRWRRKRDESEQALLDLAKRRGELDQFVTWCNRGGSVITRDDAGIKQTVSCRKIRRQHAQLDGQEAKLHAYLKTGLAEECRKAGCLPGWIR